MSIAAQLERILARLAELIDEVRALRREVRELRDALEDPTLDRPRENLSVVVDSR